MPKRLEETPIAKKEAAIQRIAASAILAGSKKAPRVAKRAPVARTKTKAAVVEASLEEPGTPPASVPAPTVAAFQSKVPMLPSPYRFPVDIDRLMTQVARASGVAFVVLGALCTLNFTAALWGDNATLFSSLIGKSNVAQTQLINEPVMQTLDPVTQTIDSAGTVIDSAANQLQSYMVIDQQAPLRGTARVTVTTPQAHRVEIFMFTDSWQDKRSLGFAQQVDAGRWVFNWDTTKEESGRNYRLSAHVWDKSAYSTNSNPDFVLQLEYMIVDNTTTATQTTTAPTVVIDKEPAVELLAPATLTGAANVQVKVAGATKVSLVVEHIDTASKNYLYNATRVSNTEWRVNWSTVGFIDGEYTVQARIQNEYGTYTGGDLTVLLDNFPDTDGDVVDEVVEEEVVPADEVVEPTPTTVPPTLPTLRMRLGDGVTLDGTERLEADMSTDVATHVYFYLRDSLSTVPRFVGAGTKTTGSLRWYTNWYTNNTPNGTYKLFARAITPLGAIDSQVVSVTVANQVVLEKTPESALEAERIVTTAESLDDETTTLKAPTENLSEEPGAEDGVAAAEDSPEIAAADLLRTHREALDRELIRLGSAFRVKDEAAIARIRTRITTLITEIVADVSAEKRNAVRDELDALVQEIIAKYTREVDRVSDIIAEREQTDILKDTDQDGISDFDEVSLYNTDPQVADTDNDGFTDGAEILAGFDPHSDVRESVIAYESPKETGIYREDLLKIDTVVAAPRTATTTSATSTGILLAGRGLPNSFVTLYIFSTPVIITVKTDDEGAFEYRFDQELEDGEHNVYVGITDNAGRIVAKSQPFSFIKEAQAITPSQAAAIDNSLDASDDGSLVSGYAFAAIVSISVVAIGLILIMLGVQLDARRRRDGVLQPPANV